MLGWRPPDATLVDAQSTDEDERRNNLLLAMMQVSGSNPAATELGRQTSTGDRLGSTLRALPQGSRGASWPFRDHGSGRVPLKEVSWFGDLRSTGDSERQIDTGAKTLAQDAVACGY